MNSNHFHVCYQRIICGKLEVILRYCCCLMQVQFAIVKLHVVNFRLVLFHESLLFPCNEYFPRIRPHFMSESNVEKIGLFYIKKCLAKIWFFIHNMLRFRNLGKVCYVFFSIISSACVHWMSFEDGNDGN